MKAIDDLLKMLDQIIIIVNLVSIVYGAGTCFFGFKFFRVQIAVAGFLNGGVFGYILGYIMGSETMAVLCGLIMGVLFCLAAFKLYKFSVFLCTFGLTAVGVAVLIGDFNVLPVLAGLIVGVISIFMVQPVIIISTGISGGLLVGSSLASMIGLKPLFTILGLALGAAGVFFQWKDNSDDPESVQLPAPLASGGAAVAEKAKQLGGGVKQAASKAIASDTAQELRKKTQELGASAKQAMGGANCPHCGQSVPQNSNFCRSCGKPTK